MSGLTPNTTNIDLVRGPIATAVHQVVHPEYDYWRPEWSKIRDAIAGQREIKRKGEIYLPKLKGADADDYKQYLSRAVFYNMSAQTLNGMLGQVFRRDPKVVDLPKRLVPKLNRLAKDGTGHIGFVQTVVAEQIAMGRMGALVDCSASVSKTPDPYVVGYTTENIIDWKIEDIGGRYQPTRVLLREFARRDSDRYTGPYTYITIYRELILELQDDGSYVYRQYVYVNKSPGFDSLPVNNAKARAAQRGVTRNNPGQAIRNAQATPTLNLVIPDEAVTPTIRGKTLDYIPFVFFGANSNAVDVEKPPLLDIVDLNLSHYRSYAELEHGRFYVAMPVYYAPGNNDESSSEYHIGPNTVWEVPSDAKPPGILEFTGQGLKALETALDQKEAQIAAIGGRMMPGTSKSTAESSEQTALRQANEYSLLLNVIQACDDGMSMLLRYWAAWLDVPMDQTETLAYRINTDFIDPTIGARELRAIQLMYEAGIVSIDDLYTYLIKAGVVEPTTSLEDFKTRLDDPNSFVNNPDVLARQRGYASRQQELDQARHAREADFTQQELDLQAESLDVQEQAVAVQAHQAQTQRINVLKPPTQPPHPPAPPKPAPPHPPAKNGAPPVKPPGAVGKPPGPPPNPKAKGGQPKPPRDVPPPAAFPKPLK